MLCPVSTGGAQSFAEAAGWEVPELRAYKLGKQRWSYNQVELVLVEAGGGGRNLTVAQAVSGGSAQFSPATQDSAVAFHVELANGAEVEVHTYLVFDAPQETASAQKASSGSSGHEKEGAGYQWMCVGRDSCSKGCKGPLLRAIQRFGKLGKRAWNAPPDAPAGANKKDPRFMYLSFDEAGTHVGARTFRLLAAVHDTNGSRLVATAVSPPIRVFANNDVPTGAAHIQVMVEVSPEWEGWANVSPCPGFIRTSRAAAARREQPQQPARAPLGQGPQPVKRQPARAAASKGRGHATSSSEDSMTDHTGSHSSSGDLLESGKVAAVRDTSGSPIQHIRRRLKTEHHDWQPQQQQQQQQQGQRLSEEVQQELQRELSLRQLPAAGLLQHRHTPSRSTAPSPKAVWDGRLWYGPAESTECSGGCAHLPASRLQPEAVAETPAFGYRRESSRAPAAAPLYPQDLFGLVGMGEVEHQDDPIHAFNELMALIQHPQPHTPGAPGIDILPMALAAMARSGGGAGAPITLSAMAGRMPLELNHPQLKIQAPPQRLPQLFQGSPLLTPPKQAAHPSSRSSSEQHHLSGIEEDPFARGLSRPASIDRMLHQLGGQNTGNLSPLRLPTASPTTSTPPSYLDSFFTGQPEVWHRHN